MPKDKIEIRPVESADKYHAVENIQRARLMGAKGRLLAERYSLENFISTTKHIIKTCSIEIALSRC